MNLRKSGTATALSIAVLMSTPAFAGNNNDDSDRQANRRSSSQRDQYQQQRYQQQQYQRQQQNRQQRQSQREPVRWVQVAYDFNNDGQFDAFEYIYTYDLDRARRASQQRRERSEMARRDRDRRERDSRYAYRNDRQNRMRDSRHRGVRVRGEIENIRTVRFSGTRNAHAVAKIETRGGNTAKVDLGPKFATKRYDLEEGDKVTVKGRWGRINEKRMVMADDIIKSDGRVISINRDETDNQRRFRGKVLHTRTASFSGMDKDHVIAKVRLDNGRTTQVNLGPEKKVDKLDLSQGDKVHLIAHRCRINGENALVATSVRSNGTSIDINRDHERFSGREMTSR